MVRCSTQIEAFFIQYNAAGRACVQGQAPTRSQGCEACRGGGAGRSPAWPSVALAAAAGSCPGRRCSAVFAMQLQERRHRCDPTTSQTTQGQGVGEPETRCAVGKGPGPGPGRPQGRDRSAAPTSRSLAGPRPGSSQRSEQRWSVSRTSSSCCGAIATRRPGPASAAPPRSGHAAVRTRSSSRQLRRTLVPPPPIAARPLATPPGSAPAPAEGPCR